MTVSLTNLCLPMHSSSPSSLQQSSYIYKGATGVCTQADRSSNLGSERLDKNGRFRCPRAAREFALVVLYEACVEGSDPLRLFERRMNMKTAMSAQFDRTLLEYYDHMHFCGTPLYTETEEQASILDESIPSKWKDESAGRILELCLMHIAMAEIVVLGTQYQVVINEAIDLAKRFCDGASPRIINGCLRSFIVKENFVEKIPSQSLKESRLQSAILETSSSNAS